MNESTDRALEAWLREGPEGGSGDGLQRALDLTHRTTQRPRWTFSERWLPMHSMAQRSLPMQRLFYLFLLALLVIGVLIATMLAGSERRVPAPFQTAIVENDPIPLPKDLEIALLGSVRGWGNRLEEVSAAAPTPRISAAGATAIAGSSFLKTLRDNDLPSQDVTVPDGLWRRTYIDPGQGIRATVWVVVFRSDAGFNCGPGPCGLWDATLVDDQTGEVVSGYSG